MARPTAAAALYPHLPLAEAGRVEQSRQTQPSPLAAAMYPSLAPKPEPTWQERRQAWRDYYFQLAGLRKSGR